MVPLPALSVTNTPSLPAASSMVAVTVTRPSTSVTAPLVASVVSASVVGAGVTVTPTDPAGSMS